MVIGASGPNLGYLPYYYKLDTRCEPEAIARDVWAQSPQEPSQLQLSLDGSWTYYMYIARPPPSQYTTRSNRRKVIHVHKMKPQKKHLKRPQLPKCLRPLPRPNGRWLDMTKLWSVAQFTPVRWRRALRVKNSSTNKKQALCLLQSPDRIMYFITWNRHNSTKQLLQLMNYQSTSLNQSINQNNAINGLNKISQIVTQDRVILHDFTCRHHIT